MSQPANPISSSSQSASPARSQLWILPLLAGGLGLLSWILAGPPAPGKIFGVYSQTAFVLLLAAIASAAAIAYIKISRQPGKIKAANLITAVFSFVFILVLVEAPAVFRLVDYNKLLALPESMRYTRIKPWEDPNSVTDPELIHLRKPNSRIQGETSGDLVFWLQIHTDLKYTLDVQYDQNGFRNTHAINQAQVAAIGDSFVEAGLVSTPELLTERLRQSLRVEVANLGQSGYSPQQELIVLRRYALPLQPKVVLWFFFEGNDLLDISRYEEIVQESRKRPNFIQAFWSRSFTQNALNALAALTSRMARQNGDMVAGRTCEFAPAGSPERHNLYFGYSGDPLSSQDMAHLSRVKDILTEANRLSLEAGSKMVLVFVPTKFRVYQDACKFEPETLAAKWIANDLPQKMADWSNLAGIPFLDLTTDLQARASQGELVYFADDGHWNSNGHAAASAAIERFINQLDLLK